MPQCQRRFTSATQQQWVPWNKIVRYFLGTLLASISFPDRTYSFGTGVHIPTETTSLTQQWTSNVKRLQNTCKVFKLNAPKPIWCHHDEFIIFGNLDLQPNQLLSQPPTASSAKHGEKARGYLCHIRSGDNRITRPDNRISVFLIPIFVPAKESRQPLIILF
jgi:hypothetical protein